MRLKYTIKQKMLQDHIFQKLYHNKNNCDQDRSQHWENR